MLQIILVSQNQTVCSGLAGQLASRGFALTRCPMEANALSASLIKGKSAIAVFNVDSRLKKQTFFSCRDRLNASGAAVVYFLSRRPPGLRERFKINAGAPCLVKPITVDKLLPVIARVRSGAFSQKRTRAVAESGSTRGKPKRMKRVDADPAATPRRAAAPAAARHARGAGAANRGKPLTDIVREHGTTFRTFFDDSFLLMAIEELSEGRLVEANDRFLKTLGFSRLEIIGKTPAELSLWVDPAPFEEAIANVKARKAAGGEREVAWRTKTGGVRRGLFSAGCLRIHGQDCVLIRFNDITERRLLEITLQEHRQTHRAILEALPDFASCLLRSACQSEVSNPRHNGTPLPSTAFIGRHISEILPPSVADRYVANLRTTLDRGGMESFEYNLTEGDRGRRTFEARMMPGGQNQVLTIIRDITSRKRSEDEVTAKSKMLTTIFETVPYIMIVVDEHARVDNINRAGAIFSGKKKSQLIGTFIGNVLSCAFSFVEQGCRGSAGCHLCLIQKNLSAVFKTGEPIYDVEAIMTLVREHQTVERILLTSMALVSMEGVQRVVVTIVDITERKRAEEIVQRQYLVSDALSLLFKPLMTPNVVPHEIAPVILEQARRVTESMQGCVWLIDPVTRGEQTIAFTENFRGAQRAMSIKETAGRSSGSGERGTPAGASRGFFTNLPSLLVPFRTESGTPVRFHRYLEVPVYLGSELVGAISLADSSRLYTKDDHDAIVSIAEFFAFAIQKYRAEQRINTLLVDYINKNKELSETENLLAASSVLLQNNIIQAKEYQKKLIEFPNLESWEIQVAFGYFPSEPVGGDLIGALKVGRNILIYSADISGHGVPAAIISTYVKACLDEWILSRRCLSPARLVRKLGRLLKQKSVFQDDFITIFIGNLNLDTRRLVYANAGAPFPVCGTGRVLSFIKSSPPSMPLSELLPLSQVGEQTVKLNRRMQLLIYSDGLTEWINEENDVCGTRGLFNELGKTGLSRDILTRYTEKVLQCGAEDDLSYILIDFATCFRKKYRLSAEDAAIAENDFRDFIAGRFPEEMNIRSRHCFSELLMNAVEHGNKNESGKTVKVVVKCLRGGRGLFFRIEDSGRGFRFRRHPQKNRQRENEFRGRGLTIVRRFADKLYFNFAGNAVNCKILRARVKKGP